MTKMLKRQRRRGLLGAAPAGQAGVTLLELMVTVVVMVILMTIAVPGFQQVMLTSRLESYANDLLSSATLARSEAIKRNKTVTLCASANGTSCATSGGWDQGWIVLDASGPTVIATHSATTGNFVISEASSMRSLSFSPSGVGATQASLKVCRTSPVGNQERVVTIDTTGRPLISTTTNGTCP